MKTLEDMPRIEKFEKRMFGIGQGGLRVTVLQLANAMATIARDGMYKSPRLFIEEYEHVEQRQRSLGVSADTIATVRDGMRAVIIERSGTANDAFKKSVLHERDVKLFGKTGSTESPENALFGGFAEDSTGRAIAFALILEEGKSGGRQAAPMMEKILVLCNEAGYIGQRMKGSFKEVEPDEDLKKLFE
jgi:cell division protein FtsI/penicillin-binding protein 2